jgi:3-dehydroquinate dehydratase/shikimate dehydrogenase
MGAAVLGAGGAARAVVYALVGERARVLILNRTPERARRLAEEFGCRFGGLERADLAGHDELIVQTTSVGMEGMGGVGIAGGAEGEEAGFRPADPLPGYRFSGREIVCDIIYTPPLTPFLRRAREAGCQIIPGTEMFLAQARAQFRLFTGREMPDGAEGNQPEEPG